jgi:uncharacterized protein
VRTIRVTGFGRVAMVPDQVTLTVGVETVGGNAVDALRSNNDAARSVIDVLKRRGVESKDLFTANLTVNPRYDDRGQPTAGYTVSNTVMATLREVGSVGAIVDAVVEVASETIRIHGLSFGIGDSDAATRVARERAVADAKSKAAELASAVGASVGAVQEMSLSHPKVWAPIFSRADFASTNSVPLESGSTEVQADVDMVFELIDEVADLGK